MQLEKKNGVKQISIGILTDDTEHRETPKSEENVVAIKTATECNVNKKEKKIKGDLKKPAPIEEPISIGRLDLRVAKIEDVRQHPDADSLYILKVNCGDEKLRTVCSGLVKFVPMAELVDRDVILLCNLKPVKVIRKLYFTVYFSILNFYFLDAWCDIGGNGNVCFVVGGSRSTTTSPRLHSWQSCRM